jgi:tetratricopeptide (TPR) repeat protein
MTGFLEAIINVAVRGLSSAISPASKRLSQWWRRHQIERASGEKLAVLVCRVSGDNSATSNYLSIREAIAKAIPEVTVHGWTDELQLPDGEERAAQAAAYQTARKWLKSKNCDLLIAGRMKSDAVISIKFIPQRTADSSQELTSGSQTYGLLLDTMDLPAKFMSDLASVLATCVFSNLDMYVTAGYAETLRRVTTQVEKIAEKPTIVSDARIRARLINCYAVGRAFLFDFGGRQEDLHAAIKGFESAYLMLDPREHLAEWSSYRCNFGAANARLGSLSNDSKILNTALEAMLDALPGIPREPRLWTKAQLNLASLYYVLARASGLTSRLQSSLDVCHELITDELKNEEPTLWAAFQDQYGRGLTALAEVQAGDDSLTRGLEAFTHALEVWTAEYPLMRAVTLINLSQALIGLSSRQNTMNGFTEAIHCLREAEKLISPRDHPLLWLALQNNLGLCLTLVADEDPTKYREPIATLRRARREIVNPDTELSWRISISLAKALVYFGKGDDEVTALEEGISILEGLTDINDPALRNEVRNNLGAAYQYLGTITNEIDYFTKSRDILRELLDYTDRQGSPFVFFRTQQSVGVALREIGVRTRSLSTLNEAAENVLSGLEFTSRDTSPITWAAVQVSLANTYLEMAKLNGEPETLELAHTAISEALSVLGPATAGSLTNAALELAERIDEMGEDTV